MNDTPGSQIAAHTTLDISATLGIDKDDILHAAAASAFVQPDDVIRSDAISTLARLLPKGMFAEAIASIMEMSDEFHRASALISIAPHLPETLFPYAMAAVIEISDDRIREDALKAYFPHLSRPVTSLPDTLLRRVIADLIAIPENAARANYIAEIVPELRENLFFEALAAAFEMPKDAGYNHDAFNLLANIIQNTKIKALRRNDLPIEQRPYRKKYSSEEIGDILRFFATNKNLKTIGGEIEEGNLPSDREIRAKHLTVYFDAAKVPNSERAGLIEKFEIEIARVTRPKWVGRLERGGELATLSAPLFLKRVHADYIADDGTVENETIRAIDPDLMKAVESYISKRKKNNPDLGDAEGLHFILTRPGKETSTEEPQSGPSP